MHWFKVLLLVLLGCNVLLLTIQAGRGRHNIEKTPFWSSFGAVLELLMLFGVLAYL